MVGRVVGSFCPRRMYDRLPKRVDASIRVWAEVAGMSTDHKSGTTPETDRLEVVADETDDGAYEISVRRSTPGAVTPAQLGVTSLRRTPPTEPAAGNVRGVWVALGCGALAVGVTATVVAALGGEEDELVVPHVEPEPIRRGQVVTPVAVQPVYIHHPLAFEMDVGVDAAVLEATERGRESATTPASSEMTNPFDGIQPRATGPPPEVIQPIPTLEGHSDRGNGASELEPTSNEEEILLERLREVQVEIDPALHRLSDDERALIAPRSIQPYGASVDDDYYDDDYDDDDYDYDYE